MASGGWDSRWSAACGPASTGDFALWSWTLILLSGMGRHHWILVCALLACSEDASPAADASVDGALVDAAGDVSRDASGLGFGGMGGFAGAGGVGGAPPPECVAPNPQGCMESGCPDGLVCTVGEACVPSRCLCEGGGWVCTEDCGGGSCVETAEPTCEGPNPQGCAETGCPDGESCMPTGRCIASACACDDGEWACSEDCEGGACVPDVECGPLPELDRCDDGCEPGSECVADRDCAAGDCDCVGGGWRCPEACYATCRDAEPLCAEPNPQGCVATGCPEGQVCQVGEACVPTACECGADGVWACSPDCGGGQCMAAPMCEGRNPQGCRQSGCPEGEFCSLDAGCAPSSCECGPRGWRCTRDCGGGQCVPRADCEGPVPFAAGCATDEDCPEEAVCRGRMCGPEDCECGPDGEWICPPDCGSQCVVRP